jgi:hypothetical protein
MKLNLYTIGQWAEDQGLVGEKETFLTGACALITWKPIGFGIISASGAGKSMTMDLLVGDGQDDRISLFDSSYFYFKDAGSATSFWYDVPYIKTKRAMVLKELQKDKSHDSVEMIKSITEGKSAVRKVTDVVNDTVNEQSIPPMPVCFSLAVENEMKPDAELGRRCITVNTDVSKKQTENVLIKKAERLWDVKSNRIFTDEQEKSIRDLVRVACNTEVEVLNPFAPFYASEIAKIAPDQKTRSLMSHFWNVIEGVTKINHLNNPIYVKDGGKKPKILVNIQDMLQGMDIYLDNFVRDIHGIPPMGDIVLEGFRHAALDSQVQVGKKKSSPNLSQYTDELPLSASYTINEVRSAIKKHQNVNLKTKTVRDICGQLVDAGYLEDDRSEKVVTYTTTDPFTKLKKPDFNEMLEAGATLVKEKYPEIYDEWYKKQLEPYVHPISGEVIENDRRQN